MAARAQRVGLELGLRLGLGLGLVRVRVRFRVRARVRVRAEGLDRLGCRIQLPWSLEVKDHALTTCTDGELDLEKWKHGCK